MPISGIPKHFVLPTDLHQTNTASGNFKSAALGNTAAAFFKQSNNSHIQKLGKALENIRSADLKARGALNNLNAGAKKFAALGSSAIEVLLNHKLNDAAKEKLLSKLKNIDLKAQIKNERLNLKQEINKANSAEDLKNRISEANGKLHDFLEKKGFSPVEKHLSEHALPKHDAEYLSNAKGHKVRINYESPSFFQKEISEAKSYIHDHRIKGASRQVANAALHGAVGIRNAIHLAKQGMYAGTAKLFSKDSEERTTLQRKAGKQRDMRRLNNAALDGNSKLAEKFDKVSNERKEALGKKLADQGYTEANPAMASTDYTTRKINDYLSQESQNPKIAKIAEYLIEAKNLKTSLKAGLHNGIAKTAGWMADKGLTVHGEEWRNKHERGRFNALFKKHTNNAALKGDLEQEVKNQKGEFEKLQSEQKARSERQQPAQRDEEAASQPMEQQQQSQEPQSTGEQSTGAQLRPQSAQDAGTKSSD